MAGIGTPGDFPGPLFTAIPPVELGWAARRRLYDSGNPQIADAYDRMCAVREKGSTTARSSSASCYGYVAEKLADRFGTTRLAGVADHGLRLRARPRSSSASRRSGAATRARRSASARTAR